MTKTDIVRCSECKYMGHVSTEDDWPFVIFAEESKCPCYNSDDPYYNFLPPKDGFCWRGEKK